MHVFICLNVFFLSHWWSGGWASNARGWTFWRHAHSARADRHRGAVVSRVLRRGHRRACQTGRGRRKPQHHRRQWAAGRGKSRYAAAAQWLDRALPSRVRACRRRRGEVSCQERFQCGRKELGGAPNDNIKTGRGYEVTAGQASSKAACVQPMVGTPRPPPPWLWKCGSSTGGALATRPALPRPPSSARERAKRCRQWHRRGRAHRVRHGGGHRDRERPAPRLPARRQSPPPTPREPTGRRCCRLQRHCSAQCRRLPAPPPHDAVAERRAARCRRAAAGRSQPAPRCHGRRAVARRRRQRRQRRRRRGGEAAPPTAGGRLLAGTGPDGGWP